MAMLSKDQYQPCFYQSGTWLIADSAGYPQLLEIRCYLVGFLHILIVE